MVVEATNVLAEPKVEFKREDFDFEKHGRDTTEGLNRLKEGEFEITESANKKYGQASVLAKDKFLLDLLESKNLTIADKDVEQVFADDKLLTKEARQFYIDEAQKAGLLTETNLKRLDDSNLNNVAEFLTIRTALKTDENGKYGQNVIDEKGEVHFEFHKEGKLQDHFIKLGELNQLMSEKQGDVTLKVEDYTVASNKFETSVAPQVKAIAEKYGKDMGLTNEQLILSEVDMDKFNARANGGYDAAVKTSEKKDELAGVSNSELLERSNRVQEALNHEQEAAEVRAANQPELNKAAIAALANKNDISFADRVGAKKDISAEGIASEEKGAGFAKGA